MAAVYIGLGSNLEDREGYLRRALGLLARHVSHLRLSSLYETEPVGYAAQGPFLNAVAVGETELPPDELLAKLKDIERQLGRVPTVRYGPRVIDVDILSYGDEVLDHADLQVPHPRLAERAFVLVPLAEVDPRWHHPVSGLSARELLLAVDVTGVRKLREKWME